jgi:hypothetical protein
MPPQRHHRPASGAQRRLPSKTKHGKGRKNNERGAQGLPGRAQLRPFHRRRHHSADLSVPELATADRTRKLDPLAVSYAAIATLSKDRGSALATVAALIGSIGAFCGAITNVLVFPNLAAAAAAARTTPGAAAQFLVTTFNSWFGQAFQYAYFIGIYAAPLLMGVALWRSQAVPRWLAVLFLAGLEVAQQQGSSGPVVVLYMLPFAAAMVLLAARIWPTAALPASQLQLEPTGVPV